MPNNKYLKPYARKLRNNSTPEEIKLWSEVLRARGFYGLQFNRQFPIDKYIADFVCRKLHLVVELDGRSHDDKKEADRIRDETLAKLGYCTLRIAESDVMHDLNNVIRSLEAELPED
ncbi:DUF559 domain-containing protein [Reichenbachiella carrageenanivorans]|uniref:DUF559 domain-containing protein n=1 Tax=Reichenbachiella carrageenanivorans TaxID=2979869 RepID=A0ABY6D320_9BACT|nr:DUF559 domain-containing protein [Reichenbachiella carrageenanivorans]UXX80556.1 DUF559 domain-containing protein [Reichenbachiella carrageenanivorans]